MDVDGESGGDAKAAPESVLTDSGQPPSAGSASAATGDGEGESEMRCTLCKAKFMTPLVARTHYSGKWHVINVQRAASGLPPISKLDAVSMIKRDRMAAIVNGSDCGGVAVPRHPFSAPPSFHPLPPPPQAGMAMGMGMRGGIRGGMGMGIGMQRSPVPFRPPMPMAPMRSRMPPRMPPRMPTRMQRPVRPTGAHKPLIDLYASLPALKTPKHELSCFWQIFRNFFLKI